MTDIIAEQRGEFIAGLRTLADFLEQTPTLPRPQIEVLYLPLRTNAAVEALALEHGLTVEYDDEGNAQTHLHFGPLDFQAYGYVDFDKHMALRSERDARQWAEQHGLELQPAVAQPAEFRPVPLAESPAAQASADGTAVSA